MKILLHIEIQRAFKNKGTAIALGTGILIALAHLIHNIPPALEATKTMMNYFNSDKGLLYPRNVFTSWIGGEGYSVESFLFYLALPLIAAIPYSGSLLEDLSSGFAKNICIRVRKQDYLTAKYIAVFIVSGTVAVIPLFLNLLLSAMILPSILPQVADGTFITASKVLYHLYGTHPYLYIAIYLIIDFIAAGFLGTVGLVMSFYTSNKFIAVSVPFIGCLFLYSVSNLYGLGGYSLTYCLQPSYGMDNWIISMIYLFIFLLFGFLYIRRGRKLEVF